ncbi:microtubule-associated protein futsch isoform X2 [Drosophila virilis]|uniref:Uncharacterized protein, isoform B n=1 Tax=Drosophila virilis TaxID=7244 RepID=A0A0Q9W1A1_DROVI|nr:mucin-17 isoform X2 [Drosophila virilis]KRF78890.1 uncharacterized protein Dvir_GJ10260, isoform B [Drosophila virilis]
MSLDGAQLNYVNAAGTTVAYTAKGRNFNVGSFLGCDLVLPDAERIHCEIQCDAFGRVVIYNHSSNEPILLNDQIVQGKTKRPLLHGARIQILNESYTWHFPKSEEANTPDRPAPEQAPNSSPSLKAHRQRRQFDNRLTVHNFRYAINSDDEGNTSIESRELELSTSSNAAEPSVVAEPERCITPPAKEGDDTMPKVNLLEATQNKENTSTPCNKLMLQLCARSDVVVTSFSPRETGVRIEKSFTRIMKPSTAIGLLSAATTPKSVYNTPKSVLSEQNDDSCSRDLMEFSTPSTSKKALTGKRPSSMFLIDLTTPQRLRPTLAVTPKHTPGSTGIISVDSTDESSDASPLVIDITNSSTPSSSKQQPRLLAKTPKEKLLAAGSTPKRTPQSLMKRALITSAKKQVPTTNSKCTTPAAMPARQSLLEARRQCLTAPRRLPFHPQPQWRTVGRRQQSGVPAKAPMTSPRKRQSVCLSSPRDNKISQVRKTLAAAAKLSPGMGMSNKLVARARRALNSPKQNTPQRIASPKVDTAQTMGAPDQADNETFTTDLELNSSAVLSHTFTIDDNVANVEQPMEAAALEAVAALINDEDNGKPCLVGLLDSSVDNSKQLDASLNERQSNGNAARLELNESSKEIVSVAGTKDTEISRTNSENNEPANKTHDETENHAIDRTIDANVSQDLPADIFVENKNNEPLKTGVGHSTTVEPTNESLIHEENLQPTGVEKKVTSHDKSIRSQETDQELVEDPHPVSVCNVTTVDVIDDSICEEVATTTTYQEVEDGNTDLHLAEDAICEEVPTSEENAAQDNDPPEEGAEQIATSGKTPRRSMRRLSVEQSAVGLTTRRSVRRASMEASNKLQQCSKPTRRASCSASLENQVNVMASATPKRKRRLTEELSTPARKSLRLPTHTPKPAAEVDESVGDMGVIVEEEDALQIEDEDYGNEVTADADEPDKIDYGMRELLKTPKNCSTPRFKGLREMMRTPKVPNSPILGNIEELLEADSNDATGTPKRQQTVNRITLQLTHSEAPGDAQDLYFKTPRGKNLMIPNEPASAVLNTCENSLATTTEYDLNATNTTLHLDKIFDDVLTAEATNPVITVEESEAEINVTAVSVANTTAPDPLSTSIARAESVEPSDTMNSEALMSIANIDASNRDPLTSTAFKPGAGGELQMSALIDERYSEIAKSSEICEVSGIQLLDQTSDSMFSEQLIVSGVDSRDVTLEETKATGRVKLRTPRKERLEESFDTDSMVGLTEPLVLSDDEDVVEVVPDGNEQLEKPNANKSVVQVEKTQLEQEHSHHVTIQEPEQDKSDFDIPESSSVKEQDCIENKSTILENSQKNGQQSTVSIVEELSVQLEVSNQTVSEIDLEATNIDETLSQIDIKRKSTIYTINVSQGELDTSLEESLEHNLSKVQEESTNELNASNAAEESLRQNTTEAPDVCEDESIIDLDVGELNTSTVNDKNKDVQFNKSQDIQHLEKELEAVDTSVEDISIATNEKEVLESELSSKEKGEFQKERSPELQSNVSKESLENNLANDTNEAKIPGTLEATNAHDSILEAATAQREIMESKETALSTTSASRETADAHAEEITKTPADGNAIVKNVTITVDLEESVIELDASVLEEADILIEQLEEQIPEIVITSPSEILDSDEAEVETIQLNELLIEISASTVAEIEPKGEATSIEDEPKVEINDSAAKSVYQADVQEPNPGSAEELLNQLNPTDQREALLAFEACSESDNEEKKAQIQPHERKTVESEMLSEESTSLAILESSITNKNESIVQLDDENKNKFNAAFDDILPRYSEESSADTNEAPAIEASANVNAPLIKPDASVVGEGDKNEQNVNEQVSETSEKSIDEEVTNVDESLIELNASVLAETDKTLDEPQAQAPAPSEVANVDESLIEQNTSVVGETANVSKQLGETPEMMEATAEKASTEATDAHEMQVTDEAFDESVVELDASVVTANEIPCSSTEKASVEVTYKDALLTLNAKMKGRESLEVPINENQTEEENMTNDKQDEPIEKIPPIIEETEDIVLDASTANASELEKPDEVSEDIKSDHETSAHYKTIDLDATCEAQADIIEVNENLLAKSSPVPESSVQAEESNTNLDDTADNVAEKDTEEEKPNPVAESTELQVDASISILNEPASSVIKADENEKVEAAPDEELGVQGKSSQAQSEQNAVAENNLKKSMIAKEESSEEPEKAGNKPESVAENPIEESADQSELNVIAASDLKKPTIAEEESSEEPEIFETVIALDVSSAVGKDPECVADNPIEESTDQSELNVIAASDQKKPTIAEEESSEEPEIVETVLNLDVSSTAGNNPESVADNPIEESTDQSELNVIAASDQKKPTIAEEESSEEPEIVETVINLENDPESVADNPIEQSLAMDKEEQSKDLLTGVEELLCKEELAGQHDKGVDKIAEQPNIAQETETDQSEEAEDIVAMEAAEEINLSSSQVESLDKQDEDEVEITEKLPAEELPVENEAVIELDDSTVDSSSVAATVIELDDSTTADSNSVADATVIARFDEAVIELNDSSTDTNSALDKRSEDTKAESPLESPPMQVPIELPEYSSSISNIENADAVSNDNLNQVTVDEQVGDGSERQAVSEQVRMEAVATEAQKVNVTENLENKMEEEPKKVRRGRRPSILVETEAAPSEPKSTKRGNRNATPTVKEDSSKLSGRLSTDMFAEIQDQEIIEKEEVQQDEDVVDDVVSVTNVKCDDKAMEKPKRHRRKSMAKVAENEEQVEKMPTTEQEKPKRRGKKLAAENVDTQVEGKTDDRTKRCGRKSALETEERQESAEKQEAEKIAEGIEISTENKSDETSDLSKTTRQERRSTVDVEVEKNVKATIAEEAVKHNPKRRGRKPTVDIGTVEKEVEVTIAAGVVTQGEMSAEASDLIKTKRRGRKAAAEAVETESPAEQKVVAIEAESETHEEKSDEANNLLKTKRRGRKATESSAEQKVEEAIGGESEMHEEKSEDVNNLPKPKRRGRKATVEAVETESPVEKKVEEAIGGETETHEEKSEEPNNLPKTKRRVRKATVEGNETKEQEEKMKEVLVEKTTDKPDKPRTRRGRKPTAVEDEAPEVVTSVKPIEEPIKEKPKRRVRKASLEVTETTETAELPERKPTRHVRKASAETVEQQAASKEHLAIIEEAADPVLKSVRLDDPVKKRGRRPSISVESVQPATLAQELVVASGSREKSATRRGRKATADTDALAETAELKPKRRGRKASDDGMQSDETTQEPAEKQARRGRKPSADVEHKAAAEAEPPVEKKHQRRGHKPSVHMETSVEEPPQAKKATARRGRKASLSTPVDDLEQHLDLQNLHAQLPEPAIVVVAASPKTQLPSSEDELTPRRREGRNLPRKNYDETSDEDKLGSSRRVRKPVASKTTATTAAKSPGAGTSPIPKPNTPLPTKQNTIAESTVEPVAPHTPTGQTIVLPDQTSSQRREGRNVPRKNYNETSDDEKPATSRGRRVRQPTAKALELLVDTATHRSATPKRRKGKAAAEDEAEQPPEKKVAADEAMPVVTKPRGGARRKAPEEQVEAEVIAAAPTAAAKRVARSRKESATSQQEEADVDDAEPKQTPAKRTARGASNARKAKAAEAEADDQPATKKARGGARAKTPVVVAEPTKANDVEIDSAEMPATKRAPVARGRAARTTKAVQEVADASETPAPTRAGRGRKVHFETTEEATAQPEQSEAPKRATRSRRK